MKKELKRNIILQYLFRYCPWKFIFLFGYTFLNKRLAPEIINEINDKRIIFVHIPKNAGSSIFDSLYNVNKDVSSDHKPIEFYYMHKELNHPLKSFAVVRNPWDRFISIFFYIKRHSTNPHKNSTIQKFFTYINQFKNVNEFILKEFSSNKIFSYKSNIFWPQYKYITNNKKRIIVDHIIKFETLNEDIKELSKKLNLTINLPHLNKSNHNHHSTYYTEETKEIIGKIYKTDIELFGYTFENKII